jgi:uncharacterized protein (DUF58 family)
MKSMRPSGRAVALALVLAVAAGLSAFSQDLVLSWKIAAAFFAGALLLDLFLGRTFPAVELEREVRHTLPVGVWSCIGLGFKNLGSSALTIVAHDHHPEHCETSALPLRVILPPGKRLSTSYRIRPNRKGDMEFGDIDLLILSPLGLWWKKACFKRGEPVKVLPNFREIKKYMRLAADNRLDAIGIRKERKRGEGSDFESLRDYRPGDSFRRIDWNKTARYLKPITKEYQDERDQQVIFLMDCGRRMRHADSDQTHFDQVLNAMLLLSHVAVRQHDAVGFLAFGGIRDWFPPQKNPKAINRMVNRVYTMEPTMEAADYLTAARTLVALQKRRSLVILVTNSRDEDHDDLLSAMATLKRRHLVILADLREKILDTCLTRPVSDLDSALLFNVAYTFLEKRKKQHANLRRQGILTLDTLAESLPSILVNEYLMIKASGKL